MSGESYVYFTRDMAEALYGACNSDGGAGEVVRSAMGLVLRGEPMNPLGDAALEVVRAKFLIALYEANPDGARHDA